MTSTSRRSHCQWSELSKDPSKPESMPFNDAHLTRTHALQGSHCRLCVLTSNVHVTHFAAVLTKPSFEEMCMGIQTNPSELFSRHQGLVLSPSHEELLPPRLVILCTVATDPNHRPRRCAKHHFAFASISLALSTTLSSHARATRRRRRTRLASVPGSSWAREETLRIG